MPPEAEEQKETKEPKKSKKKLLLILIVFIVLLGGGGAGAYFKFFASHTQEGDKSAKEGEPIIKEMDTLILNLSDPGGKRFLKISVKAKLDSQQCLTEFNARNFEMRDIVLMLLSAKEVEDISRPEDKANLKKELAGAMNRALRKGQVQDIYFTEFLIQ